MCDNGNKGVKITEGSEKAQAHPQGSRLKTPPSLRFWIVELHTEHSKFGLGQNNDPIQTLGCPYTSHLQADYETFCSPFNGTACHKAPIAMLVFLSRGYSGHKVNT